MADINPETSRILSGAIFGAGTAVMERLLLRFARSPVSDRENLNNEGSVYVRNVAEVVSSVWTAWLANPAGEVLSGSGASALAAGCAHMLTHKLIDHIRIARKISDINSAVTNTQTLTE